MDNLEYLEGVKAADDLWHESRGISYREITIEKYYEYRKMKALEIIAKEIINLNSTLENIENVLRR